jgi:hypothetical protein
LPPQARWIGFSRNQFEALTDRTTGIAMTLRVVGLCGPAVATNTPSTEIEKTLSSLFPDSVHSCTGLLILHRIVTLECLDRRRSAEFGQNGAQGSICCSRRQYSRL